MKKICRTLLLVLFIFPLLLLSACKSSGSYLISALPSDSSLGSISGVLTEQKQEGTKITLVAKETKPSTNPFICWIKDYKNVISTSSSLSLTYNAGSAGNYTAVYEEDSPNKMMYACLSKVSLNSDVYTSVAYDLNSTLLSSGSNDFSIFNSGNFTVGSEYKTDCKAVLYFGSAGTNNDYKFSIKLRLATGPNSETYYEEQIRELLNKNSFDSEGKCIIKQDITIHNTTVNLSLTFQKLTKSLY